MRQALLSSTCQAVAAGNAFSRQGKFEAALADLTRAQEICPWSVDPVLNRCASFDTPRTDIKRQGCHMCGAREASTGC